MDVKAEQVEVAKTGEKPSQLEILDVKKYPSLYGRLFIESTTGIDMMDPEIETPQFPQITQTDFDKRSYDQIFEGLSIQERKDQWEGTAFNEAYIQWRTTFTAFMQGLKDPKRIEALEIISHVKKPSEFTEDYTDALFNVFANDTNVTTFAKSVIERLSQNSKVDVANLKALLPHIEWIASGIFGEKTAGIVNRVIEIEAQLKNNPKDFQTYLSKASPGKPELGSEERSILATLHASRKREKEKDKEKPPVQTVVDDDNKKSTPSQADNKPADETSPAPTVALTEEAKWLISHFDRRRGHLEITTERFDQMLKEHGFSDEDIKGKSDPELIDMLRTKGKAQISPPAPATDEKKVDEKLVNDGKPPAPPAKEAESAEKEPDTSQEKQTNAIQVTMVEDAKGILFKLTANGKEIPTEKNSLSLLDVDENECPYLEVPSGITATFVIFLPNGDLDSIIILGEQGAKLNLKTLKAVGALSIRLNSARLIFSEEVLSKYRGQAIKVNVTDTSSPGEWMTQQDLDTYLIGVETLNEARKTLDETEPSQSSSEARENIITLEGKGNLAKELNDTLRQNQTPNVTIIVSADALREFIPSIAGGVIDPGKLVIKPQNVIEIHDLKVEADIPIKGKTKLKLGLRLENDPNGGLNAKGIRLGIKGVVIEGYLNEQLQKINSKIKEKLDEQIAADNPNWKSGTVSIDGDKVLIKFEKATRK